MIEKWVNKRWFGDMIVTSGGKDLRVDCPFCKARRGRSDTKKHLYISQIKPMAHCFRCEWSGSHVGLVMNVEGCQYHEALQHLEEVLPNIADFNQVGIPRGLMQTETFEDRPNGFQPLIRVYGDSSLEMKAAYNYVVRKRKVDSEDAKQYFGIVPGTMRVWMLIDRQWWQGRTFIGAEPKYISPPWPRGDSLWNAIALQEFENIVICEGVLSAYFVGHNAVGLCGKGMTIPQADRIIKANLKEVIFMYDLDAQQDAYRDAELLVQRGFENVVKIFVLSRGDPADYPKGEQQGKVFEYSWDEKVRFNAGLVASGCPLTH